MSSKASEQSGTRPEGPVFDDVELGTNIPTLVKRPTVVTLFLFGAAAWITHRIHYDQAYARSLNLKDVLVQGPLQAGYLVQMVTDWLCENGTIRKLTYRHHTPAYPGDVLTCTGKIKDKRVEDGKGCLDIELSIVNQNTEKVISGVAVVYIPMRHQT